MEDNRNKRDIVLEEFNVSGEDLAAVNEAIRNAIITEEGDLTRFSDFTIDDFKAGFATLEDGAITMKATVSFDCTFTTEFSKNLELELDK